MPKKCLTDPMLRNSKETEKHNANIEEESTTLQDESNK